MKTRGRLRSSVLVMTIGLTDCASPPEGKTRGSQEPFVRIIGASFSINGGVAPRHGIHPGRVALNSTIRLLALFDVATPIGFERDRTDFGQSLGLSGLKRILSLALAVLTVSLLGACVTAPVDKYGEPLADILRIPLASAPVGDSVLSAPGGMAVSPSSSDPGRVRHEEALRHELGVDHAPDGSWEGCFMRGWGEGC